MNSESSGAGDSTSPRLLSRLRVFYGWWVVAAASVVSGVGSVNSLGFTVFFLPLSEELGLSRAMTSLVRSATRLEGGLAAPIVGWLIDRLGARYMLVLGAAVAGIGFILLGTVVHNLTTLMLVFLLPIGIGFNLGFFPASMAAVNNWFVRRRTLAMSVVNASWGGAGFILVPLLSFIVLHRGWRSGAVFAGLLLLFATLPALVLVRRSPESMGLLPDGDTPEPPSASPRDAARDAPNGHSSMLGFTVRQAIRTPAFWLLVVATNFRMMAYPIILVHFVPILVWKGVSQQGAANMVAIWGLLVIPASLLLGHLADRWGKRLVLSLTLLLGAGAWLLLAFGTHPAFLYLFLIILAPFDNVGTVIWSLLSEMFGRRSFATLRGIVTAVSSLMTAFSPVYAGWVWDVTGSYTLALAPFALGLLISSLTFALLPRPKTDQCSRSS